MRVGFERPRKVNDERIVGGVSWARSKLFRDLGESQMAAGKKGMVHRLKGCLTEA